MKKRGQPKKEVKRVPVKLSILPDAREKGNILAFRENKSLSRFLEDIIYSAYSDSFQKTGVSAEEVR